MGIDSLPAAHSIPVVSKPTAKYFTIPETWWLPKGTTMNPYVAEAGKLRDPH